MANLIYFGDRLSREIGDPLPCYTAEPYPHWVSQSELVALLNAGDTVTIRPATFAEFLVAESSLVSQEIGRDVCELLGVPTQRDAKVQPGELPLLSPAMFPFSVWDGVNNGS